MTPEQIRLVKASFDTFAKYPLGTGLMFYQRLFALNREARAMFRGEIADQAQALMSMMDLIVRMLEDSARFTSAVYGLGWRHAGYGIGKDYYDAFGRALMRTVEDALGSGCTPEVRDAWKAAFDSVAHIMIGAGEDAVEGREPRYPVGSPEKTDGHS